MDHDTAPAARSEPTGLLLSALIGAGIAVGCLLIPLVHVISGPLGPAIGGFFAGSKAQARGGRVFALGLAIGATITIFATGIALAVRQLASDSGVGARLADEQLLWMVLGAIFVYASGLATLGAWFGGRAAHAPQTPPGPR